MYNSSRGWIPNFGAFHVQLSDLLSIWLLCVPTTDNKQIWLEKLARNVTLRNKFYSIVDIYSEKFCGSLLFMQWKRGISKHFMFSFQIYSPSDFYVSSTDNWQKWLAKLAKNAALRNKLLNCWIVSRVRDGCSVLVYGEWIEERIHN